MNRSTPGPSRSRTRRLMARLAAVVLIGALGAIAANTPASAASGPVYKPSCYVLCLVFTPTGEPPPTGQHVTANSYFYDVGPTPYYISIFNTRTGERLAVCGYGTQCTTDHLGSYAGSGCYSLIAYIGGSGTSMPPAPVQIVSPPLEKCWYAG